MMTMKHEEAPSCSAQLGTTLILKLKLKRSLPTAEDATQLTQGTKKIELTGSSAKLNAGNSSAVNQIQRQANTTDSKTRIKNFDQLPPLLPMFNDPGDEEWLFENNQNHKTGHSSSYKRLKANWDEAMAGCASWTLWPPKAQWLPQAGVYAKPFTVPL